MDKLARLQDRLGKIFDIEAAVALLGWDQQTYMPTGGAEARAQQKATLTTIAHDWLVADETGRLLEDLEAELAGSPYDSYESSLLRATRRHYDRQRKLPSSLVSELAKATALSHTIWGKAREQADFDLFAPHLSRIIDLTRQKAEALGYNERIYDPLLDEFEPQMKTAQVEKLFAELRNGLVPLVHAIAERRDAVDDSFLSREFDPERQWAFGLEVIQRLGFDFDHGRQDQAVHPFTTSFSPADVRLTTRVSSKNLRMALFATMHESGHGMYDQGFDRAFDRTPLSGATSLGMHESQSRLWENIVGRSRAFWTFWLPRLKEYFPRQLEGIGVEAFYRAVNRVQPTLIRVEADEVTYNLHIMLRFEIENAIIEGEVAVSALPDLWNTRMDEYLGIKPPTNREGVLQDVHWSSGYFGYFPTYSLGNLLAAQFYSHAISEAPTIPEEIERGEFGTLFSWMREKIHTPGAKFTPVEHVRRVTGNSLQTGPFLTYVRRKYTDIYGL